MSRRQRAERAAMGGDPYKTAIIRLMREFSHSHDPYTVFSDFVEICALAISNRIDQTQFEPREKRYLEIVGKYKPEEVQRFAAMFAELQMCFRSRVDAIGDPGTPHVPGDGLGDVLGKIFMALELGNDRAGQFFTPYSVSSLMAGITVGDGTAIRQQGFVTLQEPACGSAGMVVATAQAMHGVGLSYPEALHATCVDIDARCVHMAYVQLSLLGIPAVVVHGNALSLDVWGVWYTPAHILVGWNRRLRKRRDSQSENTSQCHPPENAPAVQPATPDLPVSDQLQSPALAWARESDVVFEEEEGDVALEVRVDPKRDVSGSAASLVDLFEQMAEEASTATSEVTIFDRIEQMTLF